MKILFMGTPEFAVESLRKIHTSHYEIAAVITAPDRLLVEVRNYKAQQLKSMLLPTVYKYFNLLI